MLGGTMECYRVSDLFIDVVHQRVSREGVEIRLGNLSFELLVALVRGAPGTVSIDTLMRAVWPGLIVTPETLSQRVKRLRTALDDDPKSPRYIGGVRGRGYRLVPSVEPLDVMEEAAVPAALQRQNTAQMLHRIRAAGSVVALVLLLFAAGIYVRHRLSGSAPESSTASATTPPVRQRAVATAAVVQETYPSVMPGSQRSGVRDAAAYDLILQGEATPNPERALAYYTEAVMWEPQYARAYSDIGLARFLLSLFGQQPDANLLAAEHAAQQAIAIDSNRADAQKILADVAIYRGRWLEAEARSHTALSLAMDDANIHMDHGFLLEQVGREREALAEMNRAHALSPADVAVAANRAVVYSILGRDGDAVRSAQLAGDLGFPGATLANEQAARHLGHNADAQAAALAAFDLRGPDRTRTAQIIKVVYAALADPHKKAAAIAEQSRLYAVEARSTNRSHTAKDISSCLRSTFTLALLGELDIVYEMANQCLDSAVPGAIIGGNTYLLWTPDMRAFREDPRFSAFAARLGLMEYWRQFGRPDDCSLDDGKLTCN